MRFVNAPSMSGNTHESHCSTTPRRNGPENAQVLTPSTSLRSSNSSARKFQKKNEGHWTFLKVKTAGKKKIPVFENVMKHRE